jgi:hypothetical protein
MQHEPDITPPPRANILPSKEQSLSQSGLCFFDSSGEMTTTGPSVALKHRDAVPITASASFHGGECGACSCNIRRPAIDRGPISSAEKQYYPGDTPPPSADGHSKPSFHRERRTNGVFTRLNHSADTGESSGEAGRGPVLQYPFPPELYRRIDHGRVKAEG